MSKKSTPDKLSIGAVSRETGISVETLRMWERRYGSPKSIRLPSGHRRYPMEEVQRLRAAARALEAGYRASEVAGATVDELLAMLRTAKAESAARGLRGNGSLYVPPEAESLINKWIDAAISLDENSLTQDFYAEWGRLGPLRFLEERAVPFLQRLGEQWALGRINVSDEHFASERLDHFLSMMWRRLNERSLGEKYLVASFRGDLHRLALQMVATVITVAEKRVVYIGPQSPVEEIASVAAKIQPAAVCVSISATMDHHDSIAQLDDLRASLDSRLPLLCGGAGAPKSREGIVCMTSLRELYDWVVQSPSTRAR